MLINDTVLHRHLGLQFQSLLHEDQHPPAIPTDLPTEDVPDLRLCAIGSCVSILVVHLLHGGLFVLADTVLLGQYCGGREVS